MKTPPEQSRGVQLERCSLEFFERESVIRTSGSFIHEVAGLSILRSIGGCVVRSELSGSPPGNSSRSFPKSAGPL